MKKMSKSTLPMARNICNAHGTCKKAATGWHSPSMAGKIKTTSGMSMEGGKRSAYIKRVGSGY